MLAKLCLAFALTVTWFSGHDAACSMSEADLDQCILKLMFFGNPNSIIPTNENEMTAHCKDMHDGNDCFAKYSEECLKDFPHDVTKILTAAMKRHMTERCDNPKDRAEFVQFVGCFLPREQKMPVLDQCSEKHTKMISVAVEMGQDGHIPGACCAYHLFKDCVLSHVESVCSKGHQQFWDEIFGDVANEAIAFACGELTSKQQCEKLHNPDHYKQLKAIAESTDPASYQTGFKTPVKFMLDMVRKYHHEV